MNPLTFQTNVLLRVKVNNDSRHACCIAKKQLTMKRYDTLELQKLGRRAFLTILIFVSLNCISIAIRLKLLIFGCDQMKFQNLNSSSEKSEINFS
jgi:hypothetical protein